MKKLLLSCFLLASIALPSTGQNQRGNAETTGTCSPAISGDNNQLTINCPGTGISEEQAKKMASILNKILAKQIDPDLVMGKLEAIEKLLDQYVKNTTPPPGLPAGGRPSAPVGLIGALEGNWGLAARQMAVQIKEFVNGKEEPQPKPDEGVVAFIVRSNAWHSGVMDQYKKRFAAQAITIVRVLTEKQVLDEQVAELVRDPVNPIGIRALADQLEDAGNKYRQKYGPN